MSEKLLINNPKSNNSEVMRNKQIEEMAVEFAKINCNPKGCYGCNLCDEYGSLELNCEDYLYYRTMAETFYNAGYRKQSEVIKDVLEKAASKFAGHSDYHGDTILQVLYCMAEGKEVNDAKPLDAKQSESFSCGHENDGGR